MPMGGSKPSLLNHAQAGVPERVRQRIQAVYRTGYVDGHNSGKPAGRARMLGLPHPDPQQPYRASPARRPPPKGGRRSGTVGCAILALTSARWCEAMARLGGRGGGPVGPPSNHPAPPIPHRPPTPNPPPAPPPGRRADGRAGGRTEARAGEGGRARPGTADWPREPPRPGTQEAWESAPAPPTQPRRRHHRGAPPEPRPPGPTTSRPSRHRAHRPGRGDMHGPDPQPRGGRSLASIGGVPRPPLQNPEGAHPPPGRGEPPKRNTRGLAAGPGTDRHPPTNPPTETTRPGRTHGHHPPTPPRRPESRGNPARARPIPHARAGRGRRPRAARGRHKRSKISRR